MPSANNSGSPAGNKSILPIVIVVLVLGVALAVALGVFRNAGKPAPGGNQQAQQPEPQYAPKGELTPGFPRELILDSKAAVQQSYGIIYNPATKQFTAIFTSALTATALHSQYKAYFAKNGWQITNESSKGLDGIYARKGNADVNFTVISAGGQSQVTISYLSK